MAKVAVKNKSTAKLSLPAPFDGEVVQPNSTREFEKIDLDVVNDSAEIQSLVKRDLIELMVRDQPVRAVHEGPGVTTLAANVATGGESFNSGGDGLAIVKNSTGNYTISALKYPNSNLTGVASLTQLGGKDVRVNNGLGSITVVVLDENGDPIDAAFGIIIAVN